MEIIGFCMNAEYRIECVDIDQKILDLGFI